MEPTKLIDQIVTTYLKPALQTKGFRKQGSTFWHDHGEVIDVVNVQKSQWNDGSSARFTLNLGVYWKRIHELLKEPLQAAFPKEHQCTVRQRLGFLFNTSPEFPNGRDYWWEVSATTDSAKLGSEVVVRLEGFGIPWHAGLHDLEAVLHYIQTHDVLVRVDKILELRKKGII